MDYIGKIGVFNAYEGDPWGEYYAGKKCKVIAYDDEFNKIGLLVMFNDGQKLVVQKEEFNEISR